MRTRDPFPVDHDEQSRRLRVRYTPTEIDPLEALIAKREAEAEATRAAMDSGDSTKQADPQDLRGIPCIARGVGGTSPGTDPLAVAVRNSLRYPRNCA